MAWKVELVRAWMRKNGHTVRPAADCDTTSEDEESMLTVTYKLS